MLKKVRSIARRGNEAVQANTSRSCLATLECIRERKEPMRIFCRIHSVEIAFVGLW